ncbi:MAG: DNA mismatch repair endonuclease MutL [Chloroflexaceae bacterium]
MPIQVLTAAVAAQIAAGEVVERPASVVKELLENALDAGARRIAVEARGGGLRELKVQDDGCGIPAAEVELAFERHATSKLRVADDLWAINTLGFRGEALPSIASVSQVVCVTRASTEELGSELRIAGGEVQARTPRGCSPGTSITIRNLFYNTPVRREYLRSDATEMSAISTVVQQYALAYPEVRFMLLLDGRLGLQTSGDGDLRAVLIELYGIDVARQLLPVAAQHGAGPQAIDISGMISPPGLTRSTRNYLHLFVNRRAIQARGVLAVIINEAYHTLLMKGRYPLAVLNIQVDPATVDVNVHPTKSEVRFQYQSRVNGVLGRAIRAALLEGAGVQPWSESEAVGASAQRRFELRQVGQNSAGERDAEPARAAAWGVAAGAWDTQHSRWDAGAQDRELRTEQVEPGTEHAALPTDHAAEVARAIGAEEVPPPAEQARSDAERPAHPEHAARSERPAGATLPPLRVVGQVGMTYVVAESPEGMYLIDQHAAHERITYERLMAQHGTGALESQGLLLPQTVTLPPAAAEVLLRNADALAEWGFALEEWGEGRVRLRAVPATLPLEDLPTALLEVADYLLGRGGSTPNDWRETLLTTLACHTSVRAGQALSLEEMRELLLQLESCISPRTCPHGRPTMILLTPGQLERQFGRV